MAQGKLTTAYHDARHARHANRKTGECGAVRTENADLAELVDARGDVQVHLRVGRAQVGGNHSRLDLVLGLCSEACRGESHGTGNR